MFPDLLLEAISLVGTVSLIYGFLGFRLAATTPADFADSMLERRLSEAVPATDRAAIESLSLRRKALGRVRRKAPPEESDSSSRSLPSKADPFKRGGNISQWKLRQHLSQHPYSRA